MKKLVVFSGAGISAESGLKTFRDSDGLWENYNVAEVATPEAWRKDQKMVLEFYNLRRAQVINAIPNEAHFSIPKLEKKYNVHVVTQNIDDLHERAGSKKVLHLHGEIRKSRSTYNDNIFEIEGSHLNLGDYCNEGSQLRPHVVWFGEAVPEMENAIDICSEADIFIVVGTSLSVYPAASLINYVPAHCKIFLIDPKEVQTNIEGVTLIKDSASSGLPKLVDELLR